TARGEALILARQEYVGALYRLPRPPRVPLEPFEQVRACDPAERAVQRAHGKQEQAGVGDEQVARRILGTEDGFPLRLVPAAAAREVAERTLEPRARDDGIIGGGLAGDGQVEEARAFAGADVYGGFGKEAEQSCLHGACG